MASDEKDFNATHHLRGDPRIIEQGVHSDFERLVKSIQDSNPSSTVLLAVIVPNDDKDPNDELAVREIAAVAGCSVSHVKTALGQRGGDVRLAHHRSVTGRIVAYRRDVTAWITSTSLSTARMRSPRQRGRS